MDLDKPVPGGPCWAEVGAPDLTAAKRFYSTLFGWRTETDGREEMGGYTIAIWTTSRSPRSSRWAPSRSPSSGT